MKSNRRELDLTFKKRKVTLLMPLDRRNYKYCKNMMKRRMINLKKKKQKKNLQKSGNK